MPATRTLHCEDALEWLSRQGVMEGCSFITSLPDSSETPLSLPAWKEWFVEAAGAVMRATPKDGVALFFQTDVRQKDATWTDKGYLCAKAAERTSSDLLFHKIVLRAPPNVATFGRPGYAHLLCFSRGHRLSFDHSTPDVLPRLGEMTWARAMGVEACRFSCRLIRDRTPSHTVVDPFCGVGTALAAANEVGLAAIGVDKSPKRCRRAETLSLRAE